jgi:hypothetical protein
MSDDDDEGVEADTNDQDDDDDVKIIHDIKPPLGQRPRINPLLSLSKPKPQAPSTATPLPPLMHQQTWLRFDDSRVEYKSQAELDSLIGSDSKSLATAYIMFYHRMD